MDKTEALANTERELRSLRNDAGHWEGRLSSSALATATAVVALHTVDAKVHQEFVAAGIGWLVAHQNKDGGWGDTPLSQSNLSTTLLALGAVTACGPDIKGKAAAASFAEIWVRERVGLLDPPAIQRAVVGRYGRDRTFSVPILMHCAICGLLGEDRELAWRRVLALPFELAALPRTWFGVVGLPVVSYALPALVAIGFARFQLAPPPIWNPLRWLRGLLWRRILPLLRVLQPSTGGYLEATPLTSFVTMALAAAGHGDHPCVPEAIGFLKRSVRTDGSWPIDSNLATWGTTLAIKSGVDLTEKERQALMEWLLKQQWNEVHPFTAAAPGGWAWTDLPGGVPDADDTAGALLALKRLGLDDSRLEKAVANGVRWLLDLQNRDGGMPTFCRGWGTLPFDRSTPELTAHALAAWWVWREHLTSTVVSRVDQATQCAIDYLRRTQKVNGSWVPLWFGNERSVDEENPIYGTAQVVNYLMEAPQLCAHAEDLILPAGEFLLKAQGVDGGWGGEFQTPPSIEETAVATQAMAGLARRGLPGAADACNRGVDWLLRHTGNGTAFAEAPIGLYFARLWYHERLYPVIWAHGAFRANISEAIPQASHDLQSREPFRAVAPETKPGQPSVDLR